MVSEDLKVFIYLVIILFWFFYCVISVAMAYLGIAWILTKQAEPEIIGKVNFSLVGMMMVFLSGVGISAGIAFFLTLWQKIQL